MSLTEGLNEVLEARRELERRGQAVSDAMGRHRGTEPLIEAVGRLASAYDAALSRAQAAEERLEEVYLKDRVKTKEINVLTKENREQHALIGRLRVAAQAYRNVTVGPSILRLGERAQEVATELDIVLRETSPRPAGEREEKSVSDFTQSFDAQDWARAFVERARANPGFATDEGNMIGWFSNAMMRGYDEAEKRRAAPSAERDARG